MNDDVALFIDPFSYHHEEDRLFDLSSAPHGGDDILLPWVHLRDRLVAQGVRVHTADLLERGAVAPASRSLYVTLGIFDRYPRLISRFDLTFSGFFAFECPIVEPRLYRALHPASKVFKRLFCFADETALRPFLTGPVELRHVFLPQSHDGVHEEIWSRRDRQFLAIINANKVPRLTLNELYSERLRAVEFFSRFGEIDLYGVGWNGPPFRVGTTRVPNVLRRLGREAESIRWRVRPPSDAVHRAVRATYRGAVSSKAETLGRYSFAICFENMVLDGWVTEKLFDCFLAGTVPIYLGAPDIHRSIPSECFIDMRRFGDYGELRAFLHDLSPREVEAYKQAAREYLAGPGFHPFHKERLVELFEDILEQDVGGEASRVASPVAGVDSALAADAGN